VDTLLKEPIYNSGFLFGLMLTGFAVVHLYYIINNLTSIEYIANRPTFVRADFDPSGRNFEVVALEKYVSSMYDLGFYQNWCSVMGSNPLLWFGKKKKKKRLMNIYLYLARLISICSI
jgi:hypothetical protein